jgi:hypothetical protein
VRCPPLVGYWAADGNALDSVGQDNGNINGATFAAGRFGQAFSFNGTSTVTVARAPNLQVRGGWSYSLFIRVTAYTNGSIAAGDGSYFIDRTSPTNNLASLKAVNNRFAFQIRFDDGTGIDAPVGGPISMNAWTHVAMVREAGTRFALYVDGVLVASVPDAGGGLTPPAFQLGRHFNLQGFTGQIDDLRIYDGILRLPQVQALAAGRACN